MVTGPSGSGKSTTLAAVMDLINNSREAHVITIEEPVEFVHESRRSLFHQREVGPHAHSFALALQAAIREDPDIVMLGEMGDRETMSMALEAADKGVLVFGTLHTNNAIKTIERMINIFPAGEQDAVRQVLGESLCAIVSQQLLPRKAGGRVAALEILFGSSQVGNMIREGKTGQINSLIQTGAKQGMVSMDQSLATLAKQEIIAPELAVELAGDKEHMRKLMGSPATGEAPAGEAPAKDPTPVKAAPAAGAAQRRPPAPSGAPPASRRPEPAATRPPPATRR
jgi:twitching motility protein PilT